MDVEYPWRPPSCSVCCCFGHSTTKYPSSPAPVRAPRSNNADVQNEAPAARVSRASNVQNAPAAVWIPRARTVGVQNATSSVPDPQVISAVASSSATLMGQNTATLAEAPSDSSAVPHLGPLQATPTASLQERNSPLSDMPSLHSILGSSPLSLRASGSPSAFIRDRSNALSPSSSFSGRGKEVVVFSESQVQHAPTNQDDIILTKEELYNFQVESNTYAALALDEDGIEDDISENQEDPFDDQCVNTLLSLDSPCLFSCWDIPIQGNPPYMLSKKLKNLKQALKGWPRLSITNLQKLVEVTKVSLEDIQRLLQASPLDIHLCNLERIRKAELCNFMLMEEYDLLQKSNTDWLSFGDKCNAFFHNAVKEKKSRSNIWSILDSQGVLQEGHENVAKAFISFYKELLGKESPSTCSLQFDVDNLDFEVLNGMAYLCILFV
ncbi:hypothetical protein IFM89_011425 [Coptis chinensis]|uniref:Uncharacterized protein n=1 Tax=Coptis chinensis TaxID=261450 RepID=A0A835HMG6_9MAGN|nr:hypothetical protein IFM89_011425 [Coptis chinensis]